MAPLRSLMDLFQRGNKACGGEGSGPSYEAYLPGRSALLIGRHCSDFWGSAPPARKKRPEDWLCRRTFACRAGAAREVRVF